MDGGASSERDSSRLASGHTAHGFGICKNLVGQLDSEWTALGSIQVWRRPADQFNQRGCGVGLGQPIDRRIWFGALTGAPVVMSRREDATYRELLKQLP